MAEKLRKRKMDIFGLQEIQWRGQGACFIVNEEIRYKLWLSGNDTGKGSVGILVKEEMCESVVEIRRRSDRRMTMCLIFGEEMMRVICVYASQSGKPDIQKNKFYDEMVHEWDMKGTKELILRLDLMLMLEKKWMDLRVYMEEMELWSKIWKVKFFDQKDLCVANTWFKKEEKRKAIYSSCGNEIEVDFVRWKKKAESLERCQGDSLGTATKVSGC